MVCIKKYTRGFSLIELLVSLAIATLIVGSVLFQFRAFDTVLGLKAVAYDLALNLRTAQVWSVSAGVDSTGVGYDTNVGIYVDLDNPRQYILYEDRNKNGIYGVADDFIIETYQIRDTYQFIEICYDGSHCSRDSGGPFDDMSITFQRPEFDAIFRARDTGIGFPPVANASSITFKISMTANPAQLFEVEITSTGQINVTAPSL